MRANGPFALDNSVFRLRQHGTFLSFSETCGSPSHMFRKKNVPFHPAGGESGQLSRQTPGFGTDRVTRVIYISYAVTNLEGNRASGRVEDTLTFLQRNLHFVQFFCEKDKNIMLSQAKTAFVGIHV